LASAPIYNNECIDDAGLDFIRNKAKSKWGNFYGYFRRFNKKIRK
jgi:hypothetical protein